MLGRTGSAGFALPLGLAVAVLGAACTSPGTAQVVDAVRCAEVPETPAVAALPLPPVWRTYTVPSAGFSLALPTDWDGLALGAADTDARLAEISARSPALVGSLRALVPTAPVAPGGRAVYYAVSTDDVRLEVDLARGLVDRDNCLTAPVRSTLVAMAPGRDASALRRTRLPAGEADVVTGGGQGFVGGRRTDVGVLDFVLRASTGPDLLLDFTAARPYLDAAKPVIWAAMDSLRLMRPAKAAGGAAGEPACLFPGPAAPDLAASHPPRCPVPVGRLVGQTDCAAPPADPDLSLSEVAYALPAGTPSPTRPRREAGACVFDVPAASGVSLFESEHSADLAVVLDFRFGLGGQPFVSVGLREHTSGASLSVSVSSGGDLTLDENGAGQSTRELVSDQVPLPASAVHRLVVSLSGATMRAWLDGHPTSPVQTGVTDAGPAEFYLTTDDYTAQSFRVVRAAMYAPAAAGS